MTNQVRVAAAQAARRVIDYHLKPVEALAAVEKNLIEIERIVDRAGEAKCDVLVFPKDTPGLLIFPTMGGAAMGEDEFNQANRVEKSGRIEDAITAYDRLSAAYPETWIDTVSQQRLAKLRAENPTRNSFLSGLGCFV